MNPFIVSTITQGHTRIERLLTDLAPYLSGGGAAGFNREWARAVTPAKKIAVIECWHAVLCGGAK